HGTPMLLAGDELGNTQGGNNNVYCQDNEISWINWDAIDDADRALTEFVQRVIELRQAEPLLHRHSFRDGMVIRWLSPSGHDLDSDAGNDEQSRAAGLLLSRGYESAYDATPGLGRLLLLFNAPHESVAFTLPEPEVGDGWLRLLDTSTGDPPNDDMHDGGSA